jgi:hypothetical protein
VTNRPACPCADPGCRPACGVPEARSRGVDTFDVEQLVGSSTSARLDDDASGGDGRTFQPSAPGLISHSRRRGGRQGQRQAGREPRTGRSVLLTAAAHLERQGIAQRRHRLTSDEVAEAVDLYEQGWSLSQISERFGVWPQSIGYRLRRAGVKLRRRPGWGPTT